MGTTSTGNVPNAEADHFILQTSESCVEKGRIFDCCILKRKINMKPCPFCKIDPTRTIMSNDHSLAILDGFPVSSGHALVIPKRHIVSLFEANRDEREALFDLLEQVRVDLLEKYNPDGFNIGINDGAAAGQTVMHLHIHLIPRYSGDQPDPRGGVRWIFPDKAAYWK